MKKILLAVALAAVYLPAMAANGVVVLTKKGEVPPPVAAPSASSTFQRLSGVQAGVSVSSRSPAEKRWQKSATTHLQGFSGMDSRYCGTDRGKALAKRQKQLQHIGGYSRDAENSVSAGLNLPNC